MWTSVLKRKIFCQVATPFKIKPEKLRNFPCAYHTLSKYNLLKTSNRTPASFFSTKFNNKGKQVHNEKEEKAIYTKLTPLEYTVNKCHPGVQPYLRLIRFDKPTGMYFMWPDLYLKTFKYLFYDII